MDLCGAYVVVPPLGQGKMELNNAETYREKPMGKWGKQLGVAPVRHTGINVCFKHWEWFSGDKSFFTGGNATIIHY